MEINPSSQDDIEVLRINHFEKEIDGELIKFGPYVDLRYVSKKLILTGMILFHKETGGFWIITSWFNPHFFNEDMETFTVEELNEINLEEGMILKAGFAQDPKWKELIDNPHTCELIYRNSNKSTDSGKNIIEVLAVKQAEKLQDRYSTLNVRIISGGIGAGMYLGTSRGEWQIISLIKGNDQNLEIEIVELKTSVVISEGMQLVGWFGTEKNPLPQKLSNDNKIDFEDVKKSFERLIELAEEYHIKNKQTGDSG